MNNSSSCSPAAIASCFCPPARSVSWPAAKAYRFVLRLLARKGFGQQRLLFVGTSLLAEELAGAFAQRGTNVVVGTLEVVPGSAGASSPPTEAARTAALPAAFTP